MDDKKAVIILKRMLDKYSLKDEEKEAILTAVGILSWTSLSQDKIKALGKAQKAKRDKSVKW